MGITTDMIEEVARQMCYVAGLDPTAPVEVEEHETIIEQVDGYQGKRMVQMHDVYVRGNDSYSSPNELRMKVERLVVEAAARRITVYRWQAFRRAAYHAILAHYAVKQVILAGGSVRP